MRALKPLGATPMLGVGKEDRTMLLRVNWLKLNTQLILDSGGLGGMQSISGSLKGHAYLTRIDSANGFHRIPIAGTIGLKTAFRDVDG